MERSLALFQKEVFTTPSTCQSKLYTCNRAKAHPKLNTQSLHPRLGGSPNSCNSPVRQGLAESSKRKSSDETLKSPSCTEAVAYAPRAPFSKQGNVFGAYDLIKTLGEGEFGKVKLAVHRETGQSVAVKLIRKSSMTDKVRKRKLQQEIAIFQLVDHPFVVKMHEVVETPEHIAMVMEYASGGELFDFILSRKRLTDDLACKYFAELVSGVSYLHRNGIVHRDLKLENLLLDGAGNLCITDFGFAHANLHPDDPETPSDKSTDLDTKWLTTSCGSPCYAAPELVVADRYIGPPADIWSCGVILYSMIVGYLPYDDDPNNPDGENIGLLYRYILTTALEIPSFVTPLPRSLIQSILVPDPLQRASMLEIVAHPWLEPYRHLFTEDFYSHAQFKVRHAPPSLLQKPFIKRSSPPLLPHPKANTNDTSADVHTRVNTEDSSLLHPSPRSKSLDLRASGRQLMQMDDAAAVDADGHVSSIPQRPTIDVPPFEYDSMRRGIPHLPSSSRTQKKATFFTRKLNQMMQWLRTSSHPSPSKHSHFARTVENASRPSTRPPDYQGDVNPLCVMATDDPFKLLLEMEQTACNLGFSVEAIPGTWELKARALPRTVYGTVQPNYEFPPRKRGLVSRIWKGIFGSKHPDSSKHDGRTLLDRTEAYEMESLQSSRLYNCKPAISITSHLKLSMSVQQLPGRSSLYYIKCKRHRGDPWEFQRVYGFLVQRLSKYLSNDRPSRSCAGTTAT